MPLALRMSHCCSDWSTPKEDHLPSPAGNAEFSSARSSPIDTHSPIINLKSQSAWPMDKSTYSRPSMHSHATPMPRSAHSYYISAKFSNKMLKYCTGRSTSPEMHAEMWRFQPWISLTNACWNYYIILNLYQWLSIWPWIPRPATRGQSIENTRKNFSPYNLSRIPMCRSGIATVSNYSHSMISPPNAAKLPISTSPSLNVSSSVQKPHCRASKEPKIHLRTISCSTMFAWANGPKRSGRYIQATSPIFYAQRSSIAMLDPIIPATNSWTLMHPLRRNLWSWKERRNVRKRAESHTKKWYWPRSRTASPCSFPNTT